MPCKLSFVTLLIGLTVACGAYAAGADTAPAPQAGSSDPRLATQVRGALASANGINASRISVLSASGDVTLEGSTPDAQQVDRAAQLAANVPGVRNVINHLTVRAPGSGSI
ncbi:BON domain-containing protein [Paraburkholderia oxyphila]|uniref:BON domain-containing protein n=1 Tax=Paraburkholderia oxyphila TaxID=614212 RepID=UPI000A0277E4|nr:BON domain-containing protein [Paraburkholderia oxyphila]